MSQLMVHQGEVSLVWPMLLDYDRPECFQILRRLELEAYAKVVAVFRAQGPLTGEKRKILYKLQRLLTISADRHKAEVRRVLNDEELATISEATCGRLVNEDWIVEGKRAAPILHRPSPKTIYLSEANRAALDQLCENYALPPPCETAFLNLSPQSECRPDYLSSKDEPAPKEFSNKGTQTINYSPEQSIMGVGDNESHEIDVPRVDYEVTCETESSHMPSELLNGHIKQKSSFVVDSQAAMARGSHELFDISGSEPCPSRPFGSEYESCRVSLSAQLNSAHGALFTELQPFGKLCDAVHSTAYKSDPAEQLPVGHDFSRKRSLSTSPGITNTTNTETSAPPSKLLSLVHAPNTLATPPNRRPTQTHLVQPSLSTADTTLTSSTITQPLVRGTESGQSTYHHAIQRVQTKAVHSMHIVPPVGLANRPHSQLVLQMCRPASDGQTVTDPTLCTPRSSSSVIIPSRPGQANTALRNHPVSQASPANFSFKPPLIGSRVQRPGPQHSMSSDSAVDYGHRTYSTTTTPSISMVQSLQGLGGSHRLPSSMSTIVLSSSGAEVSKPTITGSHCAAQTLVSQPLKSAPVPMVNISTNHLSASLSSTPSSSGNTDSATGQPIAARRLVSSAQPLIVPGLQVSTATSIVQNTTNTVANNNVIVFQRAMAGRKPSALCPSSIKLTPVASGVGQSASSPANPGAAGNRQIRILGLPSTAFSTSTSVATTALTTTSSTVTTVSITSAARPPQFTLTSSSAPADSASSNPTESERTLSDATSNLLSRVSRLGAMLEVDLDAEDYLPQQHTTDPNTSASYHTAHLTNPTPSAGPLLQSALTQTNEMRFQSPDSFSSSVSDHVVTMEIEAGTVMNRNSGTRLHTDSHLSDPNTSSSTGADVHSPTDLPMDERNCFDTPIEVPTSGKIDQLKAILGLTTHGTSDVEQGEEPMIEPTRNLTGGSRVHLPSVEQASCSTSDNWMFDRPSLVGYPAPEPKRARLSPAVTDLADSRTTSPPTGRQIPRPLQHVLDQGVLSVEPNPD